MYIIDLDGKRIEVTDITSAIAHAEVFISYCHDDEVFKELDEELKAYWEDILEKLETLYWDTRTKTDNL